MDISDIIITKPGGLTVSESVAKNIPMIIPFLIPGQEEENADFLVESKAAIRIKDFKYINKIVDSFIYDQDLLNKMKRNMKRISRNYSVESIVKLAGKLILKNNYQKVDISEIIVK